MSCVQDIVVHVHKASKGISKRLCQPVCKVHAPLSQGESPVPAHHPGQLTLAKSLHVYRCSNITPCLGPGTSSGGDVGRCPVGYRKSFRGLMEGCEDVPRVGLLEGWLRAATSRGLALSNAADPVKGWIKTVQSFGALWVSSVV